jgi:hypothetical protein
MRLKFKAERLLKHVTERDKRGDPPKRRVPGQSLPDTPAVTSTAIAVSASGSSSTSSMGTQRSTTCHVTYNWF